MPTGIRQVPFVVRARKRAGQHGLPATLFFYGMRAINAVVRFRILRGLSLQAPQPAFLECPEGYTAGFVPQDMLREWTRNAENELSLEFVHEALARGDQCFAVRRGATPASYGWYSFRPTRIDLPGVLLHFHPSWVYMHKGFTHPRYRGQRLHAYGMTLALRHYLACGFRGLVSYVESTNLDSLKSCARTGYRSFGSIFVLQALGELATFSSPGCEQLGFRLEPYCLSPAGTP